MPKKKGRGRPGSAVGVKEYSYVKRGKKVVVGGYRRKKPKKNK